MPPPHTHTYSRGAAAWSVALPGVGEHSFHQMLRAAPSLHGPPCIWVGPPQPGRHPGCPPWLVDEPGGGDAGFRGSCVGHKLQPWATSGLSPDPALSTCDHRAEGQSESEVLRGEHPLDAGDGGRTQRRPSLDSPFVNRGPKQPLSVSLVPPDRTQTQWEGRLETKEGFCQGKQTREELKSLPQESRLGVSGLLSSFLPSFLPSSPNPPSFFSFFFCLFVFLSFQGRTCSIWRFPG